ncbi:DUF262 domain-containing protein [Capnocytophaga bilenii]|uniref:DUF262 domain-containing protein n=1 Tax=Capnocytophaga bilenii TaxID=2819369 RepID=UPI0028D429E6|nr:DUF262 domain-containing protein [Capnocytophaga bilenii]
MKFETKGVLEIKGNFFVPDYQRGYRWGENEVKQLLEDIYENGKKTYYLQPIVVKPIKGEDFELIDGQQRLTTLYLILSYLRKKLGNIVGKKYSLIYETRKETHEFLENINSENKNNKENIDFFFINYAYETIEKWFNERGEKSSEFGVFLFQFYTLLGEFVNIIWYEPEDNVSGVELFTRLNIGRIPLTNSELVRALFLSRNSDLTQAEQLEIAAEWDNIEKELHQPSFWAFLTNYQPEDYPNRIDLLFDLMAGGKSRDKYATFFYFNNKIKEKEKKQDVWKEIIAYFARLKEWYEDREVFHKVGFLVADNNNLIQLLEKSKEMKKSERNTFLDNQIKTRLEKISLDNLNYENKADTQRVLLLFNILSVKNINDNTLRFPFDKYKNKNTTWSLEHIHAQNAETLNTTEKRKEWLRLHKEILEDETELAKKIGNMLEKDITTEQFRELQQEVFKQLPNETEGDYLDSLANMALLNVGNNAALNNSVFEVKRRKIIEMDKAGDYIPYCTRMVFLKYYTPTPSNLHSWGADDREAYIKAIEETLKPYLKTELNPEPENTKA